jgi:hypothetical protein
MQYFKKNLGKFEAKDAITFDNLGFFDVGLYVMLGKALQLLFGPEG